MMTTANRNYITSEVMKDFSQETGGKVKINDSVPSWANATGNRPSQDQCYLTFLFMIRLRERGTQS